MRCAGGVLWELKPLPAASPTTADSAPSRAFRPPALAVAAPGERRGRRGRGKMAAGGAADAQARFGHSVKGLLTEKVTSCGTDVIALTKQVLKGSRSAELLGQAARNMVMQEDAILHSEDARSNSEEVSSGRTWGTCCEGRKGKGDGVGWGKAEWKGFCICL
uniref:BLOC-1-related complex subunit 7 n=1 Tax=Junco hyemalis TaxID=40217 RepID=A0A8C5IHD1_JUNHY